MGVIRMNLTEMKAKEYEEKVKIAMKAVESVKDETLKTAAFNKILDDLINFNKKVISSEESHQSTKASSEKVDKQKNFDPTFFNGPENFMLLGWKEKLLIILDWAIDNHEKHGLTTGEIVEIFHKRYAQPYISSITINKEMQRRLVSTPYIRPVREGKKYRWFISENGKEYLKNLSFEATTSIFKKTKRTGSQNVGRKSIVDESTIQKLKNIPLENYETIKKNIKELDKKGRILACLKLSTMGEGIDGLTTSEINRCLLEMFRISPLHAATLSNLMINLEKEGLVHSKTISSGKRPSRKYILLDSGEEKLKSVTETLIES